MGRAKTRLVCEADFFQWQFKFFPQIDNRNPRINSDLHSCIFAPQLLEYLMGKLEPLLDFDIEQF